MVGIVHLDVAIGGIAAMSVVLKITAVAAFKDVDLGVVYFGIYMVVHRSVFGTQVLGTCRTLG